MLVSMANNQQVAGGSSLTLPYSCNSVQKIFVKVEDNDKSTDFSVSVQIGSKTILNAVSGWGLRGLTRLVSGNTDGVTNAFVEIDLGSYELMGNEQLYVTITPTVNTLTAVDVSAIVNEPVQTMPLRYTEYADQVFTANNVLGAIIYASDKSVIDETAGNIETRTDLYSSAPSIVSACSYYLSKEIVNSGTGQAYGLISLNKLPLSTSFNYPAGLNANTILCVQAEPVTRSQVSQAKRSINIAKAVGK